MTCIVGVETPDGVIIGGDSAGVAGLTRTNRADPKVYRNGPYLIGFTSSFRMGQILRYVKLPAPPASVVNSEALERFMCTTFIDGIRNALDNGGYAKKDSGREEGGNFLVGVHGRLFEIESDYQVAWSLDGYAACGCGWELALGALHATRGQAPALRVQVALEAAAAHSGGVYPPFNILTQ